MDTPQDRTFSGPRGELPALLLAPPDARALFVLAHGAGAGMRHRFMEAVAATLAAEAIASFRYEFPYMAAGSRRPDSARVLEATVRAAVAAAADTLPGLPLLAGGKSMGGRMTSQAQAAGPLAGVRGLCFFGFPLHRPKERATTRAAHLDDVRVPMLFLQGTRDALADLELMRGVTTRLGEGATLHVVEGADHSFAVPKRSGRNDADVLRELAAVTAAWTAGLIAQTLPSSQVAIEK